MPATSADLWNATLFEIAPGRALEVSQLVTAIIVFVLGLMLSSIVARAVGRNMRRGRLDATAVSLLQKVLFYSLLITVVLTTLHLLEIPIGMFAFLGGAAAIGVGFGAQNIINNFISGWILMAERPVRIGDFLIVDGHKGMVEHIGARCTRICRTDGVHILVPNSTILEKTIVNWTLVDRRLRSQVTVGIAYGSSTEDADRIMREAVAAVDGVAQDEPLDVVFNEFGDNALLFDIYYWSVVRNEMALLRIRSAVLHRLGKDLTDAGITIAFPQRDVHLDTLSPLSVQLVDDRGSDSDAG
jgi:small-conductance mechanosensitive channel